MSVIVDNDYGFSSDNSSNCRPDRSTFEEYCFKIESFIAKHPEYNTTLQGYNKDKIGYTKEAQRLYTRSNEFFYLMKLFEIMYIDERLNELYSICDCNTCDDVDMIDAILKKYKIEEIIKCLVCKDITRGDILELLKELGWKLNVSETIRSGINYMCIQGPCDCEDLTFFIS